MGLKDRPYWRDDHGGLGGYPGSARPGLRKPPSAVKVLLIANVAAFVVQIIGGGSVASLFWLLAGDWWQIWRYITFQFLHGGPLHLGFNMLCLYFFGSTLERTWGSKRFVTFYLTCGVVAGLAHVLLSYALGADPTRTPLLGASGGVYATLIACAILFPQMRVIYIFIPMSIRTLALLLLGMGVLGVMMNVREALVEGELSGGIAHVAHLGGAVAAAFWIWVLPRAKGEIARGRAGRAAGAWRRKMARRQGEQEQIDRILDKIKQQGLNSLSRSEKDKLRQATRRQQGEEKDLFRS